MTGVSRYGGFADGLLSGMETGSRIRDRRQTQLDRQRRTALAERAESNLQDYRGRTLDETSRHNMASEENTRKYREMMGDYYDKSFKHQGRALDETIRNNDRIHQRGMASHRLSAAKQQHLERIAERQFRTAQAANSLPYIMRHIEKHGVPPDGAMETLRGTDYDIFDLAFGRKGQALDELGMHFDQGGDVFDTSISPYLDAILREDIGEGKSLLSIDPAFDGNGATATISVNGDPEPKPITNFRSAEPDDDVMRFDVDKVGGRIAAQGAMREQLVDDLSEDMLYVLGSMRYDDVYRDDLVGAFQGLNKDYQAEMSVMQEQFNGKEGVFARLSEQFNALNETRPEDAKVYEPEITWQQYDQLSDEEKGSMHPLQVQWLMAEKAQDLQLTDINKSYGERVDAFRNEHMYLSKEGLLQDFTNRQPTAPTPGNENLPPNQSDDTPLAPDTETPTIETIGLSQDPEAAKMPSSVKAEFEQWLQDKMTESGMQPFDANMHQTFSTSFRKRAFMQFMAERNGEPMPASGMQKIWHHLNRGSRWREFLQQNGGREATMRRYGGREGAIQEFRRQPYAEGTPAFGQSDSLPKNQMAIR
ncbi:hypothetical protein [Ferrimonas balearica]|uniref:hypothetical protein n=1 Tax=Ferrimonas balearica TaxID=44012 RepID=UPI001F20BCD3|nr:hypothetical protein [Ferrimonas balearica]MBY6093865.1 hypothetical protein [Ferrimonas balearica]